MHLSGGECPDDGAGGTAHRPNGSNLSFTGLPIPRRSAGYAPCGPSAWRQNRVRDERCNCTRRKRCYSRPAPTAERGLCRVPAAPRGSGAPADLPPDYGDWKNTHRRFCRWRDRNVWAGLLEAVMDDPDYEWLMIDASYITWRPGPSPQRRGPGRQAKPLPAQKGAQQQAAPGGGLPRNAGKAGGDRRHCG